MVRAPGACFRCGHFGRGPRVPNCNTDPMPVYTRNVAPAAADVAQTKWGIHGAGGADTAAYSTGRMYDAHRPAPCLCIRCQGIHWFWHLCPTQPSAPAAVTASAWLGPPIAPPPPPTYKPVHTDPATCIRQQDTGAKARHKQLVSGHLLRNGLVWVVIVVYRWCAAILKDKHVEIGF